MSVVDGQGVKARWLDPIEPRIGDAKLVQPVNGDTHCPGDGASGKVVRVGVTHESRVGQRFPINVPDIGLVGIIVLPNLKDHRAFVERIARFEPASVQVHLGVHSFRLAGRKVVHAHIPAIIHVVAHIVESFPVGTGIALTGTTVGRAGLGRGVVHQVILVAVGTTVTPKRVVEAQPMTHLVGQRLALIKVFKDAAAPARIETHVDAIAGIVRTVGVNTRRPCRNVRVSQHALPAQTPAPIHIERVGTTHPKPQPNSVFQIRSAPCVGRSEDIVHHIMTRPPKGELEGSPRKGGTQGVVLIDHFQIQPLLNRP